MFTMVSCSVSWEPHPPSPAHRSSRLCRVPHRALHCFCSAVQSRVVLCRAVQCSAEQFMNVQRTGYSAVKDISVNSRAVQYSVEPCSVHCKECSVELCILQCTVQCLATNSLPANTSSAAARLPLLYLLTTIALCCTLHCKLYCAL